MAKYNGHKNYNHWNVSLWINNDEMLYELAKHCIRYTRVNKLGNRLTAARMMVAELKEGYGITHTPDGAPYSVTTVYAAIKDI